MKNKGIKKVVCWMWIVILFLFFVSLLVLEYLACKKIIREGIVKRGISIFGIVVLISIIIGIGTGIIKYFAKCIKNIRHCGDPLFGELDLYGQHWRVTKEYYNNKINAIYFYYKKGGKVDTIVGNDLKRLYNRLDFLKRKLNTREHVLTCIISVGLSVCATLFLKYAFENQMWCMWIFVVLFLVLILFRYFDPYSGDEQIYEYELKLLKEKIDCAEKEILINYQKEIFLLTKQNVLNELINKCSRTYGKDRESIEKDIEIIESINLNISNPYDFKEIQFTIGKKGGRGALLLDKNDHLANEQYEKLYKILDKHDIFKMTEDKKR